MPWWETLSAFTATKRENVLRKMDTTTDTMDGYKDPLEGGITLQEIASRRAVAIEALSTEIAKLLHLPGGGGVVLDVLVNELCRVVGGNHDCRYAIHYLLMKVRSMRSDHTRARV